MSNSNVHKARRSRRSGDNSSTPKLLVLDGGLISPADTGIVTFPDAISGDNDPEVQRGLTVTIVLLPHGARVRE